MTVTSSRTDSQAMEPGTPLLAAHGVTKIYGQRRGVRAVDGVDVTISAGGSVGIAGESGSGKSTLLRLLLRLEPPTTGEVQFEGVNLETARPATIRRYRQSVQAVFQDPGSSFNPRMRIWRAVTEPAWVSRGLSRDAQRELARELLASVDLPAEHLDKYPHQLSGGERQRAAIARALSAQPRLVLLDEPVTALDLSIRGSVLNLLAERARALGAGYVVVSHDLSAIYHLTDELYIMYRGIVVERGRTTDVIGDPQHPYTRMLVASVGNPLYTPDVDDDTLPPTGACPYLPRCPHALAACERVPELLQTKSGREVRCHLFDPSAPRGMTRPHADSAPRPGDTVAEGPPSNNAPSGRATSRGTPFEPGPHTLTG